MDSFFDFTLEQVFGTSLEILGIGAGLTITSIMNDNQKENYKKATETTAEVTKLTQAANKGNVNAEYNVAKLSLNTAKNKEEKSKAINSIRTAAQKGSKQAKEFLDHLSPC